MKKQVPEFKNNKEFAEFVDNNDMSKYDWEDAPEIEVKRMVKKPITLRLYPYLVDGIKKIAEKRNMPYQTLIGYWLSEKLSQEQLLELHQNK
jgi:predicted DNA binding CopG/RHH family protein